MAPDCRGFLSRLPKPARVVQKCRYVLEILKYFLPCYLHTFQQWVKLRIGGAGKLPTPSLFTLLPHDSDPQDHFFPLHLDTSNCPGIEQHGFTADTHTAGRSVVVARHHCIFWSNSRAYIQLIECTCSAAPKFMDFKVLIHPNVVEVR